MSEEENIKEYTEDEMRLALRLLVNGTFTMHVPAKDSDADLVIARAITELMELRKLRSDETNGA